MRTAPICLFLSAALMLGGCSRYAAPSIQLALDGPRLALVMRNGDDVQYGLMDRGCMAGAGRMELHRTDGVTCSGEIDRPATDKARLYMDLLCTDGARIALVFRNLGPDQGMGIGRINPEQADGARTFFFYHPSREEANRRLTLLIHDVTQAMEQKREKEKQRQEQAAEQEGVLYSLPDMEE